MASQENVTTAAESMELCVAIMETVLPETENHINHALDLMEEDGYHDEELLDALWTVRQQSMRALESAAGNSAFYLKG